MVGLLENCLLLKKMGITMVWGYRFLRCIFSLRLAFVESCQCLPEIYQMIPDAYPKYILYFYQRLPTFYSVLCLPTPPLLPYNNFSLYPTLRVVGDGEDVLVKLANEVLSVNILFFLCMGVPEGLF